jgi:hypothetical protein
MDLMMNIRVVVRDHMQIALLLLLKWKSLIFVFFSFFVLSEGDGGLGRNSFGSQTGSQMTD